MKLYLLSGFLGSGKTTAIHQACLQLMKKGLQVGVITNDQGAQLVDSAFIKSFQIPGREVVNGCFCCNYTQLETGIQSLKKENNPDIIFAESVGSCTDIIATVIKPLQQFHPELEIVLSVFADAAILLKTTESIPFCFDDDVNYIYEKQLEEADVLIVNKADLLNDKQLQSLRDKANKMFLPKKILFQNSLKEKDIQKWLITLADFNGSIHRNSLDINYDKYGTGEAKLAWLDGELEITTRGDNAVDVAVILINKLYHKIQHHQYPIGHLKFLIQAKDWQRKISFTSLHEPEVRQTHSLMKFQQVHLLINARVQVLPEILKNICQEAINETTKNKDAAILNKGLTAFQPGYPKPEYRIEH